MSSSAMDSLMSTVDTITSADTASGELLLDSPTSSSSPCALLPASAEGFVAKSPPPSPKDAKLASSQVTTMPSTAMMTMMASTPPSSTLLSKSGGHGSNKHSSHTNTASSLKTRSFDALMTHGVVGGHSAGPNGGVDATSTTTTISTTSSAPRGGGAGGRSGSSRDENAFLFLGSVQSLLGVLMAVFGVLAMLHRASMANVGSGIWGGAVSLISGVVGVIAGLRSCYSRSLRGGPGSGRTPIAPTAFMALSLVALATANLVLVLSAIGLVRDARTPDIQLLREDEDAVEDSEPVTPGSSHWERVLASCGLLLASGLEVLAAVLSGYRCYRLVCPCAARNHSPLYYQRSSGSPDSLRSGLYSSGSKERLVSRWLTRQVPQVQGVQGGPVYTGSPTPSGLLLFTTQPPPPGRRQPHANPSQHGSASINPCIDDSQLETSS